MTKTLDPSVKDIRSFTDALKSRVPMLAEELSIKRDMYGEPLHYENDLRKMLEFFNPELRSKYYNIFGEQIDFLDVVGSDVGNVAWSPNPDKVDKELESIGFQVMRVRRSFESVDLSPQEYEVFQLLAAQPPDWPSLKDRFKMIMGRPDYNKWSEHRKTEKFREVTRKYRDHAKELMLKNPDLDVRRRWEEKQAEHKTLHKPTFMEANQ